MCPDEEVSGEQIVAILNGAAAGETSEHNMPPGPPSLADNASLAEDMTFKDAKKQFEADFLRAKIEENDGNISKTAEQIGMERSHLHKKIKALDENET